MEDKGKMIITVEYAPNQGFSWRTVEEAAHFWKGYISQVRGHKVIDIETKYEQKAINKGLPPSYLVYKKV